MQTAIQFPKQRGMMLVEALISILIFSMGILGMIGLQSSMLKNSTEAKYRSDAGFLANQSLGIMWADASNLANYAVTDQAVSGLPNGKRTILVSNDKVTVTITWQMPGESQKHSYQIVTQVKLNS